MNHVAEEILMHYGVSKYDGAPGPGSGRYPAGSGENPNQHRGDFLTRVEELRKQNYTFTDKDGKTYSGDTAIAKSMGLSTTQFRVRVSLAREERRAPLVKQAEELREQGLGPSEIARQMGLPGESSVRALLNQNAKARMNQTKDTSEALKKLVNEKGMIDMSVGADKELRISQIKLNEALALMEEEGYPVYKIQVKQVNNPGQYTTMRVLCPPGTPYKDAFKFDEIHSVKDYISRDDGKTIEPKFVYPESMDSSRLKVVYGDEGGKDKDGLIEIRRGVADLDLGESHYAQVRILVDGTHYIKGMAVYSDDMPPGTDVISMLLPHLIIPLTPLTSS